MGAGAWARALWADHSQPADVRVPAALAWLCLVDDPVPDELRKTGHHRSGHRRHHRARDPPAAPDPRSPRPRWPAARVRPHRSATPGRLSAEFMDGEAAGGVRQRPGSVSSLAAVTNRSNRSKADQDPAEWLPPAPEALCRYGAEWTATKPRWGLAVDEAADRLLDIAAGCGGTDVEFTPAPWPRAGPVWTARRRRGPGPYGERRAAAGTGSAAAVETGAEVRLIPVQGLPVTAVIGRRPTGTWSWSPASRPGPS